MKNKLGQLFIIGLEGKSLTEDEKRFLVEKNIGGVILFGRNIESPKQLHSLIQEIQSLRHKTEDKLPFFVSIDMEGGRVARLKAPFTQWPPMAQLGKIDSPVLGFKFGESLGQELRSIGINLDYAPCTDVLTNPQNTVIGDRAFGADPEIVAKMASAVVRGLIKSEVISCVKHFPGHGNTLVDSHEDLPVEKDVDLERLRELELLPFKRTFRARVDMVMTAHILYPKIDSEWPATLSQIFIEKILRDELGFRGLVITDDLDMKALSKNWPVEFLPIRSFQAGADIALYCNNPESHRIGVESVEKAFADGVLSSALLETRLQRVLSVKKARLRNPDPLPLADVSRIVGHPDHLKLAKSIASGEVPAGLVS